jgi:hypothetical protein
MEEGTFIYLFFIYYSEMDFGDGTWWNIFKWNLRKWGSLNNKN